jgi:hypothetical protein
VGLLLLLEGAGSCSSGSGYYFPNAVAEYIQLSWDSSWSKVFGSTMTRLLPLKDTIDPNERYYLLLNQVLLVRIILHRQAKSTMAIPGYLDRNLFLVVL